MELVRKSQVLVVDDSDDYRFITTEVLATAGFDSFCACNGSEALDLLLSHIPHPDVIVLDIRMPVIDGWRFLALQQADTRIAAILVVVYSCEPLSRRPGGFPPNVVTCISKLAGRKALVAAIQLAISKKPGCEQSHTN